MVLVVLVCKVIFVSNLTAVLRLGCRWGRDNVLDALYNYHVVSKEMLC